MCRWVKAKCRIFCFGSRGLAWSKLAISSVLLTHTDHPKWLLDDTLIDVPDPTVQKNRLEHLDLFRGVAIWAVVGIHVTGHALRISGLESWSLLVLEVINRTLQFAVPCFLFMTALLMTFQALGKPFDPKIFFRKRMKSVVYPYLVWSVLYVLFTVITTPMTFGDLLSLERWFLWIATGKAYYHLYFMVILIQYCLVFPWIRPFFATEKKSQTLLGATFGFQLLFYWVNRLWLRIPSIGSVAFWHSTAFGLGMWVGSRMERWEPFWKGNRTRLIVLWVATFAVYLPLALAVLHGTPVNTFWVAVSNWFFSGLSALNLLGLCSDWTYLPTRTKYFFRTLFKMCGTYSLQIYLIHPMVIKGLEMAGHHGWPVWNRLSGHALMFALAMAIPLILGRYLNRTPLGPWLFGR